MDLRQQKTKRSIINAFLRLRSKKPLEKITVRELSELAEIHKATFYLHYHDIYELSESLERELIESILAGISDPASFLTNTERFNEELYCLLISHESMLGILFSGSVPDCLPTCSKSISRTIFSIFFRSTVMIRKKTSS
ncbi:MAG: TetR/AcrR family transcriptional regulator [Oscillospiraceae bacterium]|nr:TetR/AcrR family transcriptional regulator [Oscillospiraceae bacterium]